MNELHLLGDVEELAVHRGLKRPNTADYASSMDVLDRLLARAAMRGEVLLSWIRLVLCVLTMIQVVYFFGWERIPQGEMTWVVMLASLSAGVIYSIWSIRNTQPKGLVTRLYVSTTVDVLTIFATLLPSVYAPINGYHGVIFIPDFYFFTLGSIAAGLRLSRRVAIYGATMSLSFAAISVYIDSVWNAAINTTSFDHLFVAFVILVGGAGMCIGIAARNRALVYDGAEASVRAERARQRLGVYVSEELTNRILETPELQLGGSRQPVAVLFSDLRDFTAYSERLPPERLVRELNAYLDAMVKAVRAEGGVVDKFIGDSIMVVFGLLDPAPYDACRAIQAAKAMHEALELHNTQRVAQGRPAFRQGIGVHYGAVVAGNIGNADKVQFTVVGDAVNLASRLEQATKEQGVDTLISADALAAAQATGMPGPWDQLLSKGRVAVRGRQDDLEVFTLPQAPAPSPSSEKAAAPISNEAAAPA